MNIISKQSTRIVVFLACAVLIIAAWIILANFVFLEVSEISPRKFYENGQSIQITPEQWVQTFRFQIIQASVITVVCYFIWFLINNGKKASSGSSVGSGIILGLLCMAIVGITAWWFSVKTRPVSLGGEWLVVVYQVVFAMILYWIGFLFFPSDGRARAERLKLFKK